MSRFEVIIPAAGKSVRMGGVKKENIKIAFILLITGTVIGSIMEFMGISV